MVRPRLMHGCDVLAKTARLMHGCDVLAKTARLCAAELDQQLWQKQFDALDLAFETLGLVFEALPLRPCL